MHCPNCGAPIDENDEVCQYCGTVTPHGHELRSERKRLEALENLPTMKYVSVAFTVFVYVFTLGCYSPYWYATRIAHLNALNSGKKFPAWAAGVLMLAFFGMYMSSSVAALFGGSEGIEQEVFNYSAAVVFVVSIYLAFAFCGVFLSDNIAGLFGGGQELAQLIFDWAAGIGLVVSVYLAFAVRNILQAYAAKFMDKNIAVGSVAPSSIMLVLFGPLYLQHSVNRLIGMKLLAPKI